MISVAPFVVPGGERVVPDEGSELCLKRTAVVPDVGSEFA